MSLAVFKLPPKIIKCCFMWRALVLNYSRWTDRLHCSGANGDQQHQLIGWLVGRLSGSSKHRRWSQVSQSRAEISALVTDACNFASFRSCHNCSRLADYCMVRYHVACRSWDCQLHAGSLEMSGVNSARGWDVEVKKIILTQILHDAVCV